MGTKFTYQRHGWKLQYSKSCSSNQEKLRRGYSREAKDYKYHKALCFHIESQKTQLAVNVAKANCDQNAGLAYEIYSAEVDD